MGVTINTENPSKPDAKGIVGRVFVWLIRRAKGRDVQRHCVAYVVQHEVALHKKHFMARDTAKPAFVMCM